MHKTRIVVFVPTLTSGGAEKQAMILAHVLKFEYTTFLVVWDGRKVEAKFKQYIDQNKIEYCFLCGSIFIRFIKLLLFLKRNKISIIFNFLASSNFYGTIAGKLTRVKYIIGGIRNAEISKLKLILQRFLHNNFLDYTIFNNLTGIQNLVTKGFNASKCVFIPNCYEEQVVPINRLPKFPVTIVSLARFVPQKDFYTALKAVQHLINFYKFDVSKIKYRIIGYGEEELLIYSWIKELGLKDFVEMYINPFNALDLVKESDIFLMTSLFEGTSNSIMEAMALSLPIVATDAGDNRFLVDHNTNGYLAPLKDYKQISHFLYLLASDYDKRNSFGLKAQRKIVDKYSLSIFNYNYIYFIKGFSNN